MNATGKLDAKYSARWESCPLRFGAGAAARPHGITTARACTPACQPVLAHDCK